MEDDKELNEEDAPGQGDSHGQSSPDEQEQSSNDEYVISRDVEVWREGQQRRSEIADRRDEDSTGFPLPSGDDEGSRGW